MAKRSRRDGPDPREISLMLARDIAGVVRELQIDVKLETRSKLICFAPWNQHHNPKLEIELWPRPGKWNDWIEGRYGDALGLVACVVSGQPDPKSRDALAKGLAWARAYLGIETESFDREAWAKRCAEAAEVAAKREATYAEDLQRRRRAARAHWLNAQPITWNDAGGLYLAARGVDLRELPRLPRAVRFEAREPWYDDAYPPQVRHVGPCLMSAMTFADGTFASLHRIWIDPDRPGQKAEVDPPRKMNPDSAGGAIRLWRGASEASESDAIRAGRKETIVLCEGVEDGLSIALIAPELRVHAVGSLPGLLSYTPSPLADRLLIAADNDWGKPQAEQLLNRAIARFGQELKLKVAVARSPEGKDFNDLLRGG